MGTHHRCPTVGPSLPCAECTPGRTLHIPIWFPERRRPTEVIFRRQGYMQGTGDGVYWWWEWVPVTPLDGSAATREFARSAH